MLETAGQQVGQALWQVGWELRAGPLHGNCIQHLQATVEEIGIYTNVASYAALAVSDSGPAPP